MRLRLCVRIRRPALLTIGDLIPHLQAPTFSPFPSQFPLPPPGLFCWIRSALRILQNAASISLLDQESSRNENGTDLEEERVCRACALGTVPTSIQRDWYT